MRIFSIFFLQNFHKLSSATLVKDGVVSDSSRSDMLLVQDCDQAVSLDYVFSDQIFVWADNGDFDDKSPSINFYQNSSISWRFDIPGGQISSMAVDWIRKVTVVIR